MANAKKDMISFRKAGTVSSIKAVSRNLPMVTRHCK